MHTITLEVDKRNEYGKGPARRLRATGKAPAILYGKKSEPIALSIGLHEFKKLLEKEGSNAIFDLNINTDSGVISRKAMLKDRLVRPIDGAILHMDFLEIRMDETIEVSAHLEFVGEPVGAEKGGSFQIILRELRIETLPNNIPEKIEVDVSQLDIGHSIHVEEITLPEGVKALMDPSLAVATILTQRKETAGTEEEAPDEAPPAAEA